MSATFIVHSNSPSASSASANSIQVSYAASVPTGRLLVVTAHWVDDGSINATGVSDTAGSVYTPVGPKRTAFGVSRQAWVARCPVDVTTAVFLATVQLSASTTFRCAALTQFSTTGTGLSTTAPIHSEGASGAAVSGAYSTPGPDHLVIAFVFGGIPMTATGALTKATPDVDALAVFHRMQATSASGLVETVTPDRGGWGMTVFTVDTLASGGGGGGAVAPTIVTQPTNQSVVEPNTATFTVAAAGTAPLTFQWRRGGTNISGATASSYTTPATSVAADNGAEFDVVVSNAEGSVTSATRTLTVTAAADTQPPVLTGEIAITALTTTSYSATSPVATDNIGVSAYQWRLGTSGSWTAIAGGGRTVSITGRTPGTVDTIQMRAVDAAGNASAVLQRLVTLASTTTFALTSSQMFFSTDTGPQIAKPIHYSLFYNANIGQFSGANLVEGTAVTNSQGRLVLSGLAAQGPAVLLVRDDDGGVYYEQVTVA